MNFEMGRVNITKEREERVEEGNLESLPLVDCGIVGGMRKHSQRMQGSWGGQ